MFNWYQGDVLLTSGENVNCTLPLGAHVITLVVTDNLGETDTDEVIITVEDTTSPVITSISVSPNILWPVSHKMVEVTVTPDVHDICDPAPVCRIVNVTANEPIDSLGDGSTEPDWQITGDLVLNLRRARRRWQQPNLYYSYRMQGSLRQYHQRFCRSHCPA